MKAAATTWRVDSYSPEDFPQLLAMARRNLGDVDFASEEFCRWQYHENPAGDAVIVVAREEGSGEILGQNAVIPVRVTAGEQELMAGLCLNTLTDEKYRGQGVFSRLGEAVANECRKHGFRFLFRFPNQSSYPGIVGKLGFTDIGELPLLIRPLNWKKLARAKTASGVAGWMAGLAGGAIEGWRSLERTAGFPEAGTIRECTEFDERFDAFWKRNRRRYPVAVSRTPDSLNWRFLRSPKREYKCWVAEKGSDVLGYAVLREKEMFGVSAGLIVDFFHDDSAEGAQAGRALLHSAVAELRKWNADLTGSLSLPHTQEYKILREQGFWPCPKALQPRRIPACVRLLNADEALAQPVMDLANWYVTMGDFDNV